LVYNWRTFEGVTMKIELLTALSLVLMPTISQAEVECSGTVTTVGVQWDGSVVVQLSGQEKPHYICNVTAQTSGTTTYKMDPIACRSALSTLLSARGSGTTGNVTVKIKYSGPSVCTAAGISDMSAQPTAYMVRSF
jgi:hypothetical protein